MTEKTPLPAAVAQAPLPVTQWVDLKGGWYLGKRYDGYILLAHTGGLPPTNDSPYCQLTPDDFDAAVAKMKALTNYPETPK